MRKMPTLFVRDFDNDGLITDTPTAAAAWVLAGEGTAHRKWDGTCCLLRGGVLFKRYDRKVAKKRWGEVKRLRAAGCEVTITPEDCKPAPPAWEPCQEAPDPITGHWPGWVPVGDGNEDRWHREGLGVTTAAYLAGFLTDDEPGDHLPDGTYELIGPRIQAGAEQLGKGEGISLDHWLIPHDSGDGFDPQPPRTFFELRAWFIGKDIEGVVWHHDDGRMVKLKKRDARGRFTRAPS